MTFSPIAVRELLVAARRPATHRLRILAACAALLVAGGFFGMTAATPTGVSLDGQLLFHALAWMVLPATLASGLFFTADCLSEEKREGTIGLLFLTSLRPSDVVVGKFFAASLRAFEMLLACFPILAIPLLMGGVSGAEFFHTLLALANALFCSLVCGLLVSSMSRESHRAVGVAGILLLLFILGGPLLDYFSRGFLPGPGRVLFSWLSPGYAFLAASDRNSSFVPALLASHLCGWLLFGGAVIALPRCWQISAATQSILLRPVLVKAFPPVSARSSRARRRLLDRNPLVWLITRDPARRGVAWAITILILGSFCSIALAGSEPMWPFLWGSLGGVFPLLLYLVLAFQTTRSLLEARKSGLLEILLSTPISNLGVAKAQWTASWRWFLLPALALAGVNAVASLSWSPMGMMALQDELRRFELAAMSLLQSLVIFGNLTAIAWFGMWMALTSRSTGAAALRTLVFVQVIPWMLSAFATMGVVPLLILGWMKNDPGSVTRWFGIASSGLVILLSLAKDLGFVIWSRKKLGSSLREQAAGIHFSPPPLPPSFRPSGPPNSASASRAIGL